MTDECTVLLNEEFALDEERMTELSSEFPQTLHRIGDTRLKQGARFVLARGDIERLSGVLDASEKVRYRIPLTVSFLPPPNGRFAYAHLVLGLEEHRDLDIVSVHPVENEGTVDVETEATMGVEAAAKYSGVKASASHKVKKTYTSVPITVRGIGPGSDAAEWAFDCPVEQGGLPTTMDLALEVALRGDRLHALAHMTAGVRWRGVLGVLPLAWPRGTIRRYVDVVLPPA